MHLASTPPERGFARYFGFLSGGINSFTGIDWQPGKNLMRLDGEEYQVPKDFYSTDAFTDHAIEFLSSSMDQKRGGQRNRSFYTLPTKLRTFRYMPRPKISRSKTVVTTRTGTPSVNSVSSG
jgi:hypothetical protein